MPVSPGDVVLAEVKSSGKGVFTVILTNVSTGSSFNTSMKMPSAAQSSAEWIAEAPSGGGVLPLADFNTVFFGYDYTGQTKQAPTRAATISGTTGPIGLAAFNQNLDGITMDTSKGTIKAIPSALSGDGTSFSIAWMSPGP